MLGNLLGEIARRRLWPIPLVALLVAGVALLAFMKPAPPDAPAASAPAPAPAAAGALPDRAQRLLTADDAPAERAPVRRRDASDPFEPPASHGAKRAAKRPSGDDGAASGSGAGPDAGPPVGTKDNPIPVVIANAGATGAAAQPQAGAPIGDDTTTVSTRAVDGAAVDVRFGAAYPARLHRAIARTQTFAAGGRIVAIFVKYSPARDKAVFAIAPRTLVTGDVACRRKAGVCRYVDIPAGDHVRLTTVATDGTLVSRRLDVARIDRGADARAAAGAASAPIDGACLLRRMLALAADASAPAIDACRP